MIDTLWQLLEVVVNFYQGIIISDYVYSILGDRKKTLLLQKRRDCVRFYIDNHNKHN